MNISTATVNSIEPQTYTGNELLPSVEVYFDGKLLIEDKDYDVVYLDNVEHGRAEVIICGLNKFKGIVKSYFDIL